MFEIPDNTTQEIRPDVVSLICEAFFKSREMYYCDDGVYECGKFHSCWDHDENVKYHIYSAAERDEAFARFREKGYHIFRSQWTAPNGHGLYCYCLHETKKADPGRGHYIF